MPRAKRTGGSPRAGRDTPTHVRTRSRSGAQTSRELRARGRRTQRQLLDAGVEVFATKGYFAARVDDIVKLAKTSHGTFYLYFANKEELFRPVAAEAADRRQAPADARGPLEAGPAGEASLREWIARFADL